MYVGFETPAGNMNKRNVNGFSSDETTSVEYKTAGNTKGDPWKKLFARPIAPYQVSRSDEIVPSIFCSMDFYGR